MTKSKPNPDRIKADASREAQQARWIKETRRKTSDAVGSTQVCKYRSWQDRNRSKQRYKNRGDLKLAYWEGRLRGFLRITYNQFLDAVFRLDVFVDFSYSWYDKTTTKYVRNAAHQKKDLLNNKQIWREYKRIAKDKSRPHYYSGGRGWWGNYSHSRARNFVKRKIKAGEWGDLTSGNADYKFFVDPWLWR